MISISLIPNFKFTDLFYFFKKSDLSLSLSQFLGIKYLEIFESGRSAFYFLLKALGVGAGDEVIIQAFTCVAVPNAVLWTGAKPIFVDISETFNLDVGKLEAAVTAKTRAVVVQHTFGYPAQMDKIVEFCRRKKLFLIEDCAHGLGNTYGDKKLGTLGIASFFSFGRDKVISGVWGGAVATSDAGLSKKIKDLTKGLPIRGMGWTIRQILYPVFMFLILKTYDFWGVGKLLHGISRRFKFFDQVITIEEKRGQKPATFYHGLPQPLANLAAFQLVKLDAIIAHRRMLARFYSESLDSKFDVSSTYLRFSLLVSDPDGLRQLAARQNIYLGDWYDQVVAPKTVNLTAAGYTLGSCQRAEKISRQIVNLPTNPNIDINKAQKVVALIKQWK